MRPADLHAIGDHTVDDAVAGLHSEGTVLVVGSLPFGMRREEPGTYIVSFEIISWSLPDVTRNTEWPGVCP